MSIATLHKSTPLNGSSQLEYIDSDKKSGGQKDVFRSRNGQFAIGLYRNSGPEIDEFRLKRLLGLIHQINPTSGVDGPHWQQRMCWPLAIVIKPFLGVVTPWYPQIFWDNTGKKPRYKRSDIFFLPNPRARLAPEDRGDMRDRLNWAINLSESIRRLHNAGCAHSDLSANNVLFDNKSGLCFVTDLDSIVVPDFYPSEVIGTPGYIAPDILSSSSAGAAGASGRILPSRYSDLHSLAVLIYQMFFIRHPLEGETNRFVGLSAEEAIQREFGEDALYIEHPTNHANRPKVLNPPAEVMGDEIAALFKNAFVDGLHDPAKRPSASQWEQALIKAKDMLIPCNGKGCEFKWFVVNPKMKAPFKCPYCGHSTPGPIPILTMYQPQGKSVKKHAAVALYSSISRSARSLYARQFFSGYNAGDTGDEVAAARVNNAIYRLTNIALPHLESNGTVIPQGSEILLRDRQVLHYKSQGNQKESMTEVRYVG